jgi:hypothetical protein
VDDVPVDCVPVDCVLEDCVPEKSTAEVMPAAARLETPMMDVTQTATRFPADPESMICTSSRAIGRLR